ncbi:hypothetical protein Taro_013674 [Colocasia esculenta]|uniref:DUF4378 domain-containing protein n=1 Tax=Colocasia esculenta TaxID=4460 RepID=A0A843UCK1_COLES|nr:hypothetical protein [Colocasia esculenta]
MLQAEAPSSKQEKRASIPTQEEGISPRSSTTSLSDLPLIGTDHQCIASERDVLALLGETERTVAEMKLSSSIEDTRNKASFHCEVMPKRSHGGGNMGPSHTECTTPVAAETLDPIKSILLSSPSFLHSAQELLNLPHDRPADRRSTGTEKEKVADNSKLLLDCADDLMSYKRHLSELANHPLSMICSKGGLTKISMNDLVEEISGEIQELDYSGWRAGSDGASGYGLCARLERDVKCGGVWANGAWEQGWNEAMPVEEGDGVACDMETYVFEVLIEEITSDLLD